MEGSAAHPPSLRISANLALALSIIVQAGCGRGDAPAANIGAPVTLNVGFGLATGQTVDAGIRNTARSIAIERLLYLANDGRLQPRLAEQWSISPDGLVIRVRLRQNVTFHDGRALDAEVVRQVLQRDLPDFLGEPYRDIDLIAVSGREVEIRLRRRSRFVLEGLEIPVQLDPKSTVGTGPYYVAAREGDRLEMLANEQYYAGRPLIDRIIFTPYSSIRSAWAELLRQRVDMLYDVGVDAFESLDQSTHVNVYPFQRPYAFVVMFNTRRPRFSKEVRQALNAAIDRAEFVSGVFKGHATAADGPVWPSHWAYAPDLPRFEHAPRNLSDLKLSFTCLYADPSHERIALLLQKQLSEVGVEVVLESRPVDEALTSVRNGNFDVFLVDALAGPSLLRPYWFWHSTGLFNWGNFRSPPVDAALEVIRHAGSDAEYRAGVGAFQRAVIEDPPAIFLAWSERARAVSTRFEVPAEPGRDILSTLRLWRPVADKQVN